MQLPSGTVTFLFTDIEDSTPLLERVGSDVYEQLLDEHHRMVRATVEAHSGVEVATFGDGFLVAFADATEAVCAASDAQSALGAHDWPKGSAVRVRMGVHTGDVKVVNDNYVGLPVHEAARVSAAANGSQVLVSQATRDLLDIVALCGGVLDDLGPHRLKGIARPIRLYRLRHPDLFDDPRPPRTQRVSAHNLPAQTTSFVGREQELAEVTAALEATRVVTLTGVGGVGKTRLALAVASGAIQRYPDGVWLAELAPIADAESLTLTIASALGIEPRQAMPMKEGIINGLRDKSLLLVLDNCEHLLEQSADMVEDLIRACPDVSVLATSREGLSCEGEHVLTINSLEAPRHGEAISQIVSYPSVALFVERARAVRNDFSLTEDNGQAVGEIARRLEGIPLALELAAARVRSMRPDDIAARLDQVFRLLTGGRRTAVVRQRTLRATIDWSYDLLSDAERLVFDRLSVFAGGFKLEAACAVCAGDVVSEDDVEETVGSLLDKSMVAYDPSGEGRYSLLETLRQYGAERLDERAETDKVRRRHADHYATFSEHADVGLHGPDEARWVQRMRDELDNIRAAIVWALDAPDAIGVCMRICSSSSSAYGNRWSAMSEGVEQVVEAAGAGEHPLYSRVLSFAGLGRWERGDIAGAAEVGRRALEAARDPLDRATALSTLAIAAAFGGRPLESAELNLEASVLFAEAGDVSGECNTLGAAALMLSYGGDERRAREVSDEHVRRAKKLDNPTARVWGLYTRAEVFMQTDSERALELGRQAVDLARSARNTFLEGVALVTVTSLLGRQGEPTTALEAFSEVLEFWRLTGNWQQQWSSIRNLIELFARIGIDEPAVILYGAAELSGNAPPVFGPHGDRFNEVVRSLENRMGTVAFATARARGEVLDGPDVVAYAQGAIEAAQSALERVAALSGSSR